MKIGITGACGNIGNTLVKAFESKYELFLFDKSDITWMYKGTFKKVNLTEESEVEGLFEGLDIIIHLAADARLDATERSTKENNFATAYNVFYEAKRAKVKKVIFASSNWYHEKDIISRLSGLKDGYIYLSNPPDVEYWYSKSKVYGEQLGDKLFTDIAFVALRIGWTVPQDTPLVSNSPYMRAMFCSKRDLVQAFECAINYSSKKTKGYAISNNKERIFDLDETKKNLGFEPVDDSSKY